MLSPQFDAATSRLVEGDLQLDLLNVWYVTSQLTLRNTEELVERWVRPKHLGHACYFGRYDVVEVAIAAGRPLNGEDHGGNPIAAAIEAWVVTPLHVRCVQRLFAAGAEVRVVQFDSYAAESSGTPEDLAVRSLLLDHAGRSNDPAVRAKAKPWRAGT